MQIDKNYYDQKLAAEKLKRVYEIAPPRIQQYLQAEIDYVRTKIKPGYSVLELGCGYGRVLKGLLSPDTAITGVDKSLSSLSLARNYLPVGHNINLIAMNAINLGFKDGLFDIVCCIQNGISAFKVDNIKLLAEAVRVTRPGGVVLFSTYARKFWRNRLEWFEIQAAEGLLGEVDYDKTGDGEIVCKDGFKATTYSPAQLSEISDKLHLSSSISEIDLSSVFLEIAK